MLQIAGMAAFARLKAVGRLVQAAAMTRFANFYILFGQGAMDPPRIPIGGMGIRFVAAVAANPLGYSRDG